MASTALAVMIGMMSAVTPTAARSETNPDPYERAQALEGSIRTVPASSEPPVCVAARNARERNSPAAPGLSGQCGAALERAASLAHPPKKPPTPLGRKQPTGPKSDPFERRGVPLSTILNPPPICVAAQNARGRNSPAAPGLERQCQVAMEAAAAASRAAPPAPIPMPPPIVSPGGPLPPPVVVPGGSWPSPPGYPTGPGPWQPSSVCDAAREARYYNSPNAWALEEQCRAQGGGWPGPVTSTPYPPGSSPASPICLAAQRARYNNDPGADRLEALCRAGGDAWGVPGQRRPLSATERFDILDIHHRMRPYSLRIEWDVVLEDAAARWAAQMAASGQLMHDRMISGGQGENLYMAVPGGRYSMADVARIWASERASFRPGIFPDVMIYGAPGQVTNYTQMIWPDTTRIGCAVERTAGADYFVCRYSPAGNIIGRPIR